MSRFQYQGRNAQGQSVSGKLEADSAEAVAGQLLNRGITPVTIGLFDTTPTLSAPLGRWLGSDRVSAEELIMFTRQMYTITKAGIPLIRALRGLAQSTRHEYLRAALDDIGDRLETGASLSAALQQHADIFSNLYISMIHAGENSGQLERIFDQLSLYLARDLQTRKSIKSALRYPSFVLAALVVAMSVVNVWVIPQFAGMFTHFGAELPLLTRLLIGMSDFFVNYWLALLAGLVALAGGWRRYLQTRRGQLVWGRLKLRLPIVGDIVERAGMAHYSRSFGLMLRSGVPLTQALSLCARAIDNPFLGDKIQQLRGAIERGDSLTRAHSHSGMFTPLVLQMMAVGEESGQLDSLLVEVAEFYEREVDYDLKSLAEKIEPLLIVVMAGFVLVLALGIFLPMWELYSIQR